MNDDISIAQDYQGIRYDETEEQLAQRIQQQKEDLANVTMGEGWGTPEPNIDYAAILKRQQIEDEIARREAEDWFVAGPMEYAQEQKPNPGKLRQQPRELGTYHRQKAYEPESRDIYAPVFKTARDIDLSYPQDKFKRTQTQSYSYQRENNLGFSGNQYTEAVNNRDHNLGRSETQYQRTDKYQPRKRIIGRDTTSYMELKPAQYKPNYQRQNSYQEFRSHRPNQSRTNYKYTAKKWIKNKYGKWEKK